MTATWGIHPLRPSLDFLAEDLIVLERPGVGDLRRIGDDEVALTAALKASYPRKSADTLRQWAATLARFAFTASEGDLVVHPDAQRRTLSFGHLGGYLWRKPEGVDQHCRRVQWRRTGIAIERFSAGAQKAVGGRAAFFGIHEDAGAEFEAYVKGSRGRR